MIYFISDTHFYHTNIIKYCNRPFKDINEMNEVLINNWNNTVKPSDIIYFLGDFCLGNKEDIINIFIQLNGCKFLVRGNHDHKSITFYETIGFNVLTNNLVKLDEYKVILSHKPLADIDIPDGYINIHGHIHNKDICEDYPDYSPELHFNVSADAIDFKPISLNRLKK